MVDVTMLRPGDRVKIIDAWPGNIGQAGSGEMDKWLGKCMTVREIGTHAYFESEYKPCVKMVEDQNKLYNRGWFWSSEMIDYIIDTTGDTARIDEESLDILFS